MDLDSQLDGDPGVRHARDKSTTRGHKATSMRTTALASTEWAARPVIAGRAVPAGWGRRLRARPWGGGGGAGRRGGAGGEGSKYLAWIQRELRSIA
jgi:hypothetical protein